MSERTIDARGLPCPQPVILTKKGLNDPYFDVFTVIVDNDTAYKNVIILAEKQGALFTSESQEDGHYITLTRNPSGNSAVPGSAAPDKTVLTSLGTAGAAQPGKSAEEELKPAGTPFPGPGRIDRPTSVLMINSAVMGRGNDELGGILIRGFFHALVESDTKPRTIIFYNTGVELTVEGSPVLDDLFELEKYGVALLACGTCLEYFGLKDSHAAGSVSNMYTITETLLEAERVINL